MANTSPRNNISLLIEQHLEKLPFYCKDYVMSKLSTRYNSKLTIYEYLKEWTKFFDFLVRNSHGELSSDLTKISPQYLENIRQKTIESYIIEMQIHNKSINTINRSISALKSLFRYLSVEYEDVSTLDTLITRNVMQAFSPLKDSQSLQSRALSMQPYLLLGNKTQEFLDFVEFKYEEVAFSDEDKIGRGRFLKNKERDLAIMALMLGSGIRVSECANLQIAGVNLTNQSISIHRKGDKDDNVYIAEFSVKYLNSYLDIREDRYNTTSRPSDFVFVTNRTKSGKHLPISISTIEKFVEKYSIAFGQRITPHKFRHTLATRLYTTTHSKMAVSTQLGHSNSRTGDLYMQLENKETKQALDKL